MGNRRNAVILAALVAVAALLTACSAPTPTPQVVVVTSTFTPEPRVVVVTATFTPSPEVSPTPTSTPTFTPTPTPMPTLTFTPIPLPSPTPLSTARPSPVAISLKEGWVAYTTAEFTIALPESWEVVDVGQEGIEAILDLLKDLNTDWAQNVTQMLSAETMEEALKLWAMDTQPAGAGYATANISYQQQPFAMRVEPLLAQLESGYKQFGVQVLSTEAGLEINGLEAGRIVIRLQVGPFAIKQYQYLYGHGKDLWILTLAVDETAWEDYNSVFTEIAGSFRPE